MVSYVPRARRRGTLIVACGAIFSFLLGAMALEAEAAPRSKWRGASAQSARTGSGKWARGRTKAPPAKAAAVEKAPPPKPAPQVVPTTITGEAVVTIASGGLTSTSARMASDLSAVLDGDKLRILPLMTRSSLGDAMALAGMDKIDLAFLPSDALDGLTGEARRAAADRVTYLARLYNEEVHVIARRDIGDLRDLAGKTVNVGSPGSSNAQTAELIFERLGIEPRYTYLDQPTALARVSAGDIAADVLISGRPVKALQDFPGEGRFKLLAVPYAATLQDLYLPARIEAVDYGNLVPAGSGVETLAVPMVLAAIDAPAGSLRAARLTRFAQTLFDRFDGLRDAARHPKWREVNLAASVRSWARFPAVQQLIENAGTRPATTDRPTSTPMAAGSPLRDTSR